MCFVKRPIAVSLLFPQKNLRPFPDESPMGDQRHHLAMARCQLGIRDAMAKSSILSGDYKDIEIGRRYFMVFIWVCLKIGYSQL